MHNEINNNLHMLDNEDRYQDTINSYNNFSKSLETLKSLEDFEDLIEQQDLTSLEAEAIASIGVDQFDDLQMSMEDIDWTAAKEKMVGVGKGISSGVATSVKFVGSNIGKATVMGWDVSRKFYDSYLVTLTDLRKELKSIETKLSTLKDMEPNANEIELRREALVLSVDYRNITSPSDLLSALKELTDTNEYVYLDWSKEVLNLGEQILKITSTKHDNVLDNTKALVDTLKTLDFNKVESKLNMSRTELLMYKNIDVNVGKPLLNNSSLFCMRPDIKASGSDDPLTVLNGLRKRQFKLLDTKTKEKKETSSKVTVDTLSLNDIKELLAMLDKNLEILETYDRKNYSSRINKTGRQIQLKMDKSKINIFGDRTKAYVNGIYRVSGSYLKMGTVPFNDLMNLNVLVTRSTLMYIKRSIATYR